MSRSYKKNSIEKWSDSDNYGKRKANRKFRRKDRHKDYEDEYVILHHKVREVSDNWDWSSDGHKEYIPNKKIRK